MSLAPDSRVRRALGSDHLAGWMFVAPAVVLIGIFGLVPIAWSAIMSFQANDLVSPPSWVGLANYQALVKDPAFIASVRHTLVYTALFVPLSVAGSLLVAWALNRKLRGVRFYRLAVFVPVITSTVATGIIFLWLLDPVFGLVNYLLSLVGLPEQGSAPDHNEFHCTRFRLDERAYRGRA